MVLRLLPLVLTISSLSQGELHWRHLDPGGSALERAFIRRRCSVLSEQRREIYREIYSLQAVKSFQLSSIFAAVYESFYRDCFYDPIKNLEENLVGNLGSQGATVVLWCLMLGPVKYSEIQPGQNSERPDCRYNSSCCCMPRSPALDLMKNGDWTNRNGQLSSFHLIIYIYDYIYLYMNIWNHLNCISVSKLSIINKSHNLDDFKCSYTDIFSESKSTASAKLLRSMNDSIFWNRHIICSSPSRHH